MKQTQFFFAKKYSSTIQISGVRAQEHSGAWKLAHMARQPERLRGVVKTSFTALREEYEAQKSRLCVKEVFSVQFQTSKFISSTRSIREMTSDHAELHVF